MVKNKGAQKSQRSSVSAEVYGKFNTKQTNFVARVVKKSDDQKKKLTEKMMMSFLFNTLEEKDLAKDQLLFNKEKLEMNYF